MGLDGALMRQEDFPLVFRGALRHTVEHDAQFLGKGCPVAHVLVEDAGEIGFDGALMGQQGLAIALGRRAFTQAIDGGLELDRLLAHARQQRLLTAHRFGQRRQALDQRGVGRDRRLAALFGAPQRAGEVVEAVGGALEQGFDIGRYALLAIDLHVARKPGGAGQPFFEFDVEAALRLARLQLEEAQHQ